MIDQVFCQGFKFQGFILLGLLFIICGCSPKVISHTYRSDDLEISPISDHTYLLVSYLNFRNFGKVACNSLLYVKNGEAIIFDTPTDNETSRELINWVQDSLKVRIKAVVVNHFHVDCLGGLEAFHQAGIPSYANDQTIALARADSVSIPQNGFEGSQTLKIGGQEIINSYFGAAHTLDNIVSWIPSEKLIFGGCMVKSIGAGKGNLADADVNQWPKTIQKIKGAYPSAEMIIPGHGKYGDQSLLDFTINLFSEKKK